MDQEDAVQEIARLRAELDKTRVELNKALAEPDQCLKGLLQAYGALCDELRPEYIVVRTDTSVQGTTISIRFGDQTLVHRRGSSWRDAMEKVLAFVRFGTDAKRDVPFYE